MKLQELGWNNRETNGAASRLTVALFTLYLLALCWILVLKLGVRFSYMAKRSVNLIPFREPLFLNGKANMPEIILNIIVFIPLGVYAGILFQQWSSGKKILFFFLVSAIVEALQYSLAIGAFDITDIINNTFGGIIGLLLYKATKKGFNNTIRAQKFINIIAGTATVIMILLLALLKLNMLPIRYQ